MIDPENVIHQAVVTMEVRTVTISVTAKVTTKYGDEFRSIEASEGWTLRQQGDAPIAPDVARAAAIYYTPNLFSKVFTDLYAAGAITFEEVKQRVAHIKDHYQRYYELLVGGSSHGVSAGASAVRGAGDVDGPDEASPGAGAPVLSGAADGHAAVSGSTGGHPDQSEP